MSTHVSTLCNVKNSFSDTIISNVSVFIGETKDTPILCASYSGPSMLDERVQLVCYEPVCGRFVEIRFQDKTFFHLRLSEVEVYAKIVKGLFLS